MTTRPLFFLGVLLLLVLTSACTDTDMAKFNALGSSHHIKQFSGGVLIGEWDSTGRVSSPKGSDGWQFEDTKTRRLVEVSGDVQITIN